MRVILFHHGQLVKIAASSISPESCNIAFVPLLEANGKNLIPPAKIQIITADHSLLVFETFNHVNPLTNDNEKNIAPNDNAGIKYGKNAVLDTKLDNQPLLFLETAYPIKIPNVPAIKATTQATKTERPNALQIV